MKRLKSITIILIEAKRLKRGIIKLPAAKFNIYII